MDRTKTYRAATLKDALIRVRRDLGGSALILETREVRRRRFLGLRSRSFVEVKAAAGSTSPPEAVSPGKPGATATVASRDDVGERLGRLHELVESLSKQARLDHPPSEIAGEYASILGSLLDVDVPERIARKLTRHVAERSETDEAPAPESIRARLIGAVEQYVSVAPPIAAVTGARRVVALVGPTGVGKTTTLAKLAAELRLTRGLRPGLLTVDTYRIAAAEQLRTYAEILDVPIVVVNHASEMRRAVEELGDVDLVLIDTAGRGPRDEARIRELGEFLAAAQPDEIHLVLSATSGERSLRAAIDRFASLRIDRLILTKLDEVEALGGLLAAIGHADRPVSYVTAGQAVPEDIEPADRTRLARWILGYESIK